MEVDALGEATLCGTFFLHHKCFVSQSTQTKCNKCCDVILRSDAWCLGTQSCEKLLWEVIIPYHYHDILMAQAFLNDPTFEMLCS